MCRAIVCISCMPEDCLLCAKLYDLCGTREWTLDLPEGSSKSGLCLRSRQQVQHCWPPISRDHPHGLLLHHWQKEFIAEQWTRWFLELTAWLGVNGKSEGRGQGCEHWAQWMFSLAIISITENFLIFLIISLPIQPKSLLFHTLWWMSVRTNLLPLPSVLNAHTMKNGIQDQLLWYICWDSVSCRNSK